MLVTICSVDTLFPSANFLRKAEITYFTSLKRLRELGIDLKSQGASSQRVDISEEFMRKIDINEGENV